MPEIESISELEEALAGAADARVREQITSVAAYNDFREWALSVKGSDGQVAGTEAVLASEHAWPSYVLGAEALFENEPSIMLSEMSVETGGDKRDAAGTIMKVSVTVKDGGQVVNVDASKVAALFECTSDLADWTGEASLKPTVTEKGVEEEALHFEITPAGPAERAFLRLAE